MKYMSLDQRGHVQAEYIWIDANGGTRSKTKVSLYPASSLAWQFFFTVCDWLSWCRYRSGSH